ncbi:MAG: nucleoside recognition protein [Lachnospiraceae bacterium]|nr:nucleoside recognition protein [Lachnospiraceae bacterium]MCI9150153.1 nucleoside recognition protein [Lachnospiraceae bacterium]
MLNYLWGFMLLIGIIYGSITGNLPALTDAALNSAKEAVALCITMLGIMSFWVGLMRIAENAGIITSAARKMKPLLKFLFPRIPAGHPALEYISTNMIANVLGLGWAATPAGLKAMEELGALEEDRRNGGAGNTDGKSLWPSVPKGVASNEMCTFLIINISSLQLIPVNIIAYRNQYGSVNPSAIVGPGILATFVSTLAAVVFCKVMEWRRKG